MLRNANTLWRRLLFLALAMICSAALIAQDPGSQVATDLRLNQIQIIGTHNSYHAGLAPSEAALLRTESARYARALDYSHPPLDQQLAFGIRQIELDVFPDPNGGRFMSPRIADRVRAAGLPPDPPAQDPAIMALPGFKVMHLQDEDQRSTCATLRNCLTLVRTWSQANPTHVPVFILLECKEPTPRATPSPTVSEWTPKMFDALDAEIRSVFPDGELITPDQVRGHARTPLSAIQSTGWPTLNATRGKVLFLLDNRELGPVYMQGHPHLHGRVLFPNSTPDTPDAIFVEVNGGSMAQITALVRAGYLVRTRADSDTMQARTNNTVIRDRAIASGAQIISTDYPSTEPSRWTGYSVGFPTATAGPASGLFLRCDPVNAGPSCDSGKLETDGPP